jgi:hypothetical protein
VASERLSVTRGAARSAECGTLITQDERDDDDVRENDDGREYHWACLQEYYERQRLADGDEG